MHRLDRVGAAMAALLFSSCASSGVHEGGGVVVEVEEARPDQASSSAAKSPSKAPYWVTFDLEDEAAIVANVTLEAAEESKDAYRAGMRALEQGDYEAAIEHFIVSHRKHPGPAQKWRIAHSLDKFGNWDEALLSYRWFIAAQPGTDYVDQLATANERIALLDQVRSPAVASVAPASPADLATARLVFQQGVVDFQQGSYQRARESFMKAHALSAKAPVLLNIAICELRLNMSQACKTYGRYLHEAGASAHRSSQLDGHCGP